MASPRKNPTQPKPPFAARIVPQRLKSARVLVADFDSEDRRFLTKLLNDVGVRHVVESKDHLDVLHKILAEQPSVLLLNWTDPATDINIKLMKIIRSDKFGANEIPVVAVVSQVTLPRATQILASGINEMVMMPLSPAALFGRIDAAVNRPRAFVKTPGYFGPTPRNQAIVKTLLAAGANPGAKILTEDMIIAATARTGESGRYSYPAELAAA